MYGPHTIQLKLQYFSVGINCRENFCPHIKLLENYCMVKHDVIEVCMGGSFAQFFGSSSCRVLVGAVMLKKFIHTPRYKVYKVQR